MSDFNYITDTRVKNKIEKKIQKVQFTKEPYILDLKKEKKKKPKSVWRKKPVPDIIDEKMLYQKAMEIPYLPTRMFIFATYLSAGRRGEVEGLLKRDISYKLINEKPFAVFHMRNLKNRKRPIKDVPVALDTFEKKDMFKQIVRYTHYLSPNELLFKNAKKQGWTMRVKRAMVFKNHRFIDYKTKNYIYKDFNMFPHFIRHIRLSQIVRDYPGINPIALQYIAGWSSLKMAQVYIHSSWEEITRYMLGNFKNG